MKMFKFVKVLALLLLFPSWLMAASMLTNGGFESGTTGWNNLVGSGAATYSLATGADAYAGTNALKIEVTTAGTNAWDIQSLYGAWGAVSGTDYTLTFWAKAATAGESFNVVQQVGSTYQSQSFALTTAYKQYSWTFTAGADALEFKLQFPSVATIYLDNFEILSPVPVVAGDNMVSNGNFEASFLNWMNLSTPTGNTFSVATGADVAEGSKAMKVEVVTAGTNAYDIQSIHSGWSSIINTSYTVTFYARALVAGAQIKMVQQNSTYAEKIFTLSTTYTKYSWTFTAQETGLMLRFNFPQVGTFFIDDVFIADPTGGAAAKQDSAVVSLAKQYQTMQGFGGALTWYSDWIKYGSAANLESFYQTAFDDLGIDILRIMNNYYPDNYLTNYPANTAAASLPADRLNSLKNSIEFAKRAKKNNQNVDVLLCSWSPPADMKSNGKLREGGLKKVNSTFMYSEYARYWQDLLATYKTAGLTPDYVSIQNEPGYQNSGWETCEFRPTETADYASYTTAFDSVYNRLSKQTGMPKLIGPEVENIGTDPDLSNANTYTSYTSPLKAKTGLYAYAYHLYNFGGNGEATIMSSAASNTLDVVKNGYSDKPNFMTEFGGFDWFANALMIHQTVTKANAAAYIHWELAWENDSIKTAPQAAEAIGLTSKGAFIVKPNYYTLKHFCKFIDKGYIRLDVANTNTNLAVSAYKNPAKNQITMVVINRATNAVDFAVNVGKTIASSAVYQSVEGSYFQTVAAIDAKGHLSLPARSISTVVVDYVDAAPVTQTIELKAGWNLFSINVLPVDSTVASVFSGWNVKTVKTMDGFWMKGQDDALNSVHFISAGKGYLVYMNADASLKVTGLVKSTFNTPTATAQWTLCGCPYQSSVLLSTLFNSTNCSAVKNFDGFWIPANALSNITDLEPGKACFIKK